MSLSGRLAFFAALWAGLSVLTTSPALAGVDAPDLCGSDVVNRFDLDAAPLLKSCIDRASSEVIELVPGRYYLKTTLDLGAKSNVTLRTRGVSSGPACLSEGASVCAVLVGHEQNRDDTLLNSLGARNLTLAYIAIDGNIGPRRARAGDVNLPDGKGYNATIHDCLNCKFIGFASVRAMRGTALEFDGDGALFERVLFRDNGWDIQSAPDDKVWRYADGLTIWSSKNVIIRNSIFAENTDIDLILGNAPNAVIENNLFSNTHSYAFAALMLDNFTRMPGDFSGAIVRNNRVSCGEGMCGIGINIGPHMWYPSKPVIGGEIAQNTIVGARQGILTNGALGTVIRHNVLEDVKTYVNKDCVSAGISWSPNDEVTFESNSLKASPTGLGKCTPQGLAFALYAPQGTEAQVAQIYREILARNPDGDGGRYMSEALKQGRSLRAVRSGVAGSSEAQSLLETLCRKWLNRDLDKKSRQLWTDYLIGGGSIAKLQAALQMSAEFDEGYDIIVIGGQSNAVGAGRGRYRDSYTSTSIDGRIDQLGRRIENCVDHEGQIVPATETLEHWLNCPTWKSVGFGLPFARRYATHRLKKQRRVLIIPAAMGGSSIEEWHENLWPALSAQIRSALAVKGGTHRLVAFLWSQGETDFVNCNLSGADPACSYDSQLKISAQWREKTRRLFDDFRRQFDPQAQVPIFATGFVPALENLRIDKDSQTPCPRPECYTTVEVKDHKLEFEAELVALEREGRIPNFFFISTSGLTSNGEVGETISPEELPLWYNEARLHFSAEAMVGLADRMWGVFSRF